MIESLLLVAALFVGMTILETLDDIEEKSLLVKLLMAIICLGMMAFAAWYFGPILWGLITGDISAPECATPGMPITFCEYN